MVKTLYGKLDRLYKLHLIICPASRIQEKETRVHPLAREIEAVYEHLSGDVTYRFPDEIQAAELHHGLKQHLAGELVDYTSVSREAVLRGHPERWLERLRIRVTGGAFIDPPEHTRANRDRAHAALLGKVEEWRQSTMDFDELFRFELAAGAEVMMEAYRSRLLNFQQYMTGDLTAMEDVVNAPLLSSIVPGLMRLVAPDDEDQLRAIEVVDSFLRSDDGERAPFNWNSALLIAGLARKIKAGQKTLNSGTLNDVIALSSVAPYADAIFTDDAMASLLAEAPLDSLFISSARIFSNRTRDDFLSYLDSIEAEADPRLLAIVNQLYGSQWSEPYYGLVDYVKSRKDREST